MRSGLIQEIISAAHEYEQMERELEELRMELDREPQRYDTCSICEWQVGERFALRPFANKYTTSLYVCKKCQESGLFDKYEAFWKSINNTEGGE